METPADRAEGHRTRQNQLSAVLGRLYAPEKPSPIGAYSVLVNGSSRLPGREPAGVSASRGRREPLVLLALVLIGLVASGWSPNNRVIWLLEAAPLLVGLPILIATYRRFPFTPLSYRLTFLFAALLLVGSHYTYSLVPSGLALKRILDFRRNHFDRLVHFVGGFTPAILGRELVRRKTNVTSRGWLFFFVVAGCLAGAAAYELLEWAAAEAMHGAAREFLATQGDNWDTQWDMFCSLTGAVTSLLLLSRIHDRQLRALPLTRSACS